ncbi:hypothetical protein AYO44_15530 [Planctomycetaceae bacterium SCGC AG-212-F19]|nr:hypothetical protein AYO44_15530 [Planctomycetaceae bacterium SCGC AG-212-F19]
MPPTPLPKPEKLRALVLYGHRQTADTLGELLAVCGQDVHVAYDGAMACGLARKHRPDVVLLDLRMYGLDVGRWLRQQPEFRDTALVAIIEPEQEEAGLCTREHGFTHYLVEPVDPVQVQVLVKKLKNPR